MPSDTIIRTYLELQRDGKPRGTGYRWETTAMTAEEVTELREGLEGRFPGANVVAIERTAPNVVVARYTQTIDMMPRGDRGIIGRPIREAWHDLYNGGESEDFNRAWGIDGPVTPDTLDADPNFADAARRRSHPTTVEVVVELMADGSRRISAS